MKNLAKLKLQQAQMKGKTKPMMSARTARAVPQMRQAMKHMTGIKHGGDVKVLRPKPTYKGKILKPKPIKPRRGWGITKWGKK
jgi:hypothetical protein